MAIKLKKTVAKPKIKVATERKADSQKKTLKKTLTKKQSSEQKGNLNFTKRPASVKPFKAMYEHYSCKEDYEADGVKWIEPMTAKEPLDDKMLKSMLDNKDIIAEDKLDGTRCLLHINNGTVRLFSRTVSRKTGWFSENSDRMPHIRDHEVDPDLGYTVLDGELKIPNKPFETVSGILNCLPKESVERQEKDGKIVLNVFDILWYKGECVEMTPLHKRKELLNEILETLDCEYLINCPWFTETITVPMTDKLRQKYLGDSGAFFSTYPLLNEAIRLVYSNDWDGMLTLNKAEYYEYVVANGGEGIMLKNPLGMYYHKRGREFTKYKKFLTRDCIAVRLTEPTKEYTGKELKTWGYWHDPENPHHKIPFAMSEKEVKQYQKCGYIPVTKPFYYGWFGNVVFGVVVTPADVEYLEKVNGKAFKDLEFTYVGGNKVLIVGECAGFDDVTKDKFTKNPDLIVGKCIEVRCNEVFKKTGKLRHPRFMRLRPDKDIDTCIFRDHIQSDGEMNE